MPKGVPYQPFFCIIFGDFYHGSELFDGAEARKLDIHVILKMRKNRNGQPLRHGAAGNARKMFFKEVVETRVKMTKVIDELKGCKLSGFPCRNLLTEWQGILFIISWCN